MFEPTWENITFWSIWGVAHVTLVSVLWWEWRKRKRR